MSDPFLGEIKMWAFNWAPKGWLLCNGAELPVKQNEALFSLLGDQFGGDRKTKFNLPDLRGRTPVGAGRLAPDGTIYVQGNIGGAETVALSQSTVPPHMHTVNAYDTPGTATFPANGNFATAVPSVPATPQAFNIYLPSDSISFPGAQTLASDTVSGTGGSMGHENMQPFAVVNFCICTLGNYPPRP